VKNETPISAGVKSMDASSLDRLTGGAFTAPTTGERSARIREWLASEPAPELMAEVFRELSQRDKGAAKPLKEKLDEIKRQKAQEAVAGEWAARAHALLEHARLNVADAMAWQRDAAKAGAPLSREPLAGLKVALAERVKAVEDLQHRIQVEREAAVLLAQRIEVMSTKPLQDSTHVSAALAVDVAQWGEQAQQLAADAQWGSIDPRFAPMLDTSRAQLNLVWQAFEAALQHAVAALADPTASLPAVPVWADEIRKHRGEAIPDKTQPSLSDEEQQAFRVKVGQVVGQAAERLAEALAQGQGKAIPKAAADLRHAVKENARWLPAELEGRAQTLLAQAGDLEGWQRWRADQLRQELVGKAEALLAVPETQRLGGRKMQEALRALRESWKQTDQGGQPNHALWKRFDEACTQAHKVVELWLEHIKSEAAAHRAQRLALIQELDAWTLAHQGNTDWKAQARDLHRFGDAWRNSGHLGEKQFAELQPLWKTAQARARAALEQAQEANLAQRKTLIAQAEALGAAETLRMDAVRVIQQEWQHLAQAVPLDRKLEQKLWDAFRQPIDAAFQRKDAAREKQAAALSEHDQRVLAASQALQEANASGDAQRIHQAMSALQQAMHAAPAAAAAPTPAPITPDAQASSEGAEPADAASVVASDAAPAAPTPPAPVKKLVAMRGDDRPGMKKELPAAPGRGGRPGERRDGTGGFAGRRDGAAPGQRDSFREGRDSRGHDASHHDRGPRLGDAAFRAQRDALEHAQASLKKLAAQAHGQSLTQLLDAWQTRDGGRLPSAADLGSRVNASTRQSWVQSLGTAPAGPDATALLRLEMAADVPTPAQHLDARRALQLTMLTRRNDPAPAQTWGLDASRVLAGPWDEEHARRLQQALKVLLRRF